MPWYRCRMVGENFPGALLDTTTPVGFYATRFVEADSPEDAETQALSNLSKELNIWLPMSVDRPANAEVVVESIEEVEHAETGEESRGFSFFISES